MSDALEVLKTILKDERLHFGIGIVTKVGVDSTGIIARAQVKLLPEQREVICEMSFDSPESCDLVQVGDLVSVGFADGHPDEAMIVGRHPNDKAAIPAFARTGNKTVYARDGKKLYLGSGTKVGIGRKGIEPNEPLALGTVLVNALTDIIAAFTDSSIVVDTPLGPGFLDPAVRSALAAAKSKYLTTASTNIVSQVAFTERGV